jgi:small subunit ribosomal protein S17
MPRRLMQGRVVSDKPDQTIVVVVERRYRHPVYGKFVRKSSKFHAHDPLNKGKVGDTVTIRECRPLSKLKRWELCEGVSGEEARAET